MIECTIAMVIFVLACICAIFSSYMWSKTEQEVQDLTDENAEQQYKIETLERECELLKAEKNFYKNCLRDKTIWGNKE